LFLDSLMILCLEQVKSEIFLPVSGHSRKIDHFWKWDFQIGAKIQEKLLALYSY
jgi:hypothetical protein